jgi:hypothetical protein
VRDGDWEREGHDKSVGKEAELCARSPEMASRNEVSKKFLKVGGRERKKRGVRSLHASPCL